jgi:hypothetical protein
MAAIVESPAGVGAVASTDPMALRPIERRPIERRPIGRDAIAGGRHRRDTPGLIPVTAFVAVVRRGLLSSWFRQGRHRRRSGW